MALDVAVVDGGVRGDAADAAAVVGGGGAQAQARHRREGQRARAGVHVHRRLCKQRRSRSGGVSYDSGVGFIHKARKYWLPSSLFLQMWEDVFDILHRLIYSLYVA